MSHVQSRFVPPYGVISDAIRSRQVIPFLGSGASLLNSATVQTCDELSEGILPTAAQLAIHLAQKARFPQGEARELAKVAQYYDVVSGRDLLNKELRNIFACDYPFTSLHRYLAKVSVPLLIVTTNYDDLMERALSELNCPHDRVIHTTDTELGHQILWWPHGRSEPRPVSPNKLDVDLRTTTIVYKMHGAVDRHDPRRDQYVITEDDYIDFLARMTKNKAIPAIFAEPFQSRHFLFLGYGLRDWNLRVVLNRIEKELRRHKGIKSWAIQNDPSPLEKRFWQERGVEVYNMPLEDFVGELSST
jgi:hypothetical protein